MYMLVVVSMFKNENLTIGEWIEHNVSMGVEHFYLVDNGSTDDYERVLRPHVDAGIVTLVVDPRRSGQDLQLNEEEVPVFDVAENRVVLRKGVYRHTQDHLINHHFLETVKANAEWVMFIDSDEYMYPPTRVRGGIRGVMETVPSRLSEVRGTGGTSDLESQSVEFPASFP
jgi:cellulose synthase/poly-beta-1,6-N-acetylglucosamine synthase-like glycosyltransferase